MIHEHNDVLRTFASNKLLRRNSLGLGGCLLASCRLDRRRLSFWSRVDVAATTRLAPDVGKLLGRGFRPGELWKGLALGEF